MNDLTKLFAEAFPTGTFGRGTATAKQKRNTRTRQTPPTEQTPETTWTAAEQARHRRALLDAIEQPLLHDDTSSTLHRPRKRHREEPEPEMPHGYSSYWTPAERAQHVADLNAALDAIEGQHRAALRAADQADAA
ncbi:hypothetical protein [Streptomyces albidoflavus]|uniref:hypothetical protein n=1 Tax=Streptomyces albidoflavus TaxID=1886 RepID=UPI000524A76C|nr:hypothetical protein [Streptomyces albidoflavus]